MSLRYEINVTEDASRDANEYKAYIRRRSNDDVPAEDWWDGLKAAIRSLQLLPERCPGIPEQGRFSFPLHQLLYDSHRIIFTISGKSASVLRIYHSALRPLLSLQQSPRRRSPNRDNIGM